MTENSEHGVAEDEAKRHDRRRFVTIAGAAAAAGAAGAAASVVGAEPVGAATPIEAHASIVDGSAHGIDDLIAAGTAGLPTTVDGFTSSAIQAAINSLPPEGGTVWFPSGTYTMNSLVTLRDNVTLTGVDVILKPTAPIGRVFHGIGKTNIKIDGLTFDSSQNVAPYWARFIELQQVSHLTITNCAFLHATETAVLITGKQIRISDCRFEECYVSGVRVDAHTSAAVVGGSAEAALITEDVWIQDNYFFRCQSSRIGGNAAIQFHGTLTPANFRMTVTGNTVIETGHVGIGLDTMEDSHCSGNFVDNRDPLLPAREFGECIAFTGSGNTVSDNVVFNNNTGSAAGILLWIQFRPLSNNTIHGNHCYNAGQGIGYVWAETGDAVINLSIHDNVCNSNNIGIQSYKYPEVVSGTQSGVVIYDNHLLNNVAGPLNIIQGSQGITGFATVYPNTTSDFGLMIDGDNSLWSSLQTFNFNGGDQTSISMRSTSETGGQATLRLDGRFSGTPNAKSAGVLMRRRTNSQHVEVGLFSWNATSSQRVDGFYIDEKGNTVMAGTWNGPHMIMAGHHFWVDGSGNFRKKLGAPASDTDGTIV